MAKILIADDSSFMRTMVVDILKKGGYQDFVEAKDGKDAIEKINSESVDLILLDIIMPELDGMGVLKELNKRKDAGNPVPKVVVISAVGQEEMIEKARNLGVTDYLVKPFEEEKVLEVVKKVLAS